MDIEIRQTNLRDRKMLSNNSMQTIMYSYHNCMIAIPKNKKSFKFMRECSI